MGQEVVYVEEKEIVLWILLERERVSFMFGL